MRITWLGHAAFLIETETEQGKVRIITDPYSSRTGYDPIDEAADVVTLSHENPKYHSCLDEIEGERRRKVGKAEFASEMMVVDQSPRGHSHTIAALWTRRKRRSI